MTPPNPTHVSPELPDGERARLTALLDALPISAALFRPDGHAVAVNGQARSMFVVNALAPLAGQHWNVVLQPFGAPLLEAIRLATSGTVPDTLLMPYGQSGRMADVRLSVFDHDLLLVSAVDVTERERERTGYARAERELRTMVTGRLSRDERELERIVEERVRALVASQDEQERERRLAAVGQLAAGVMHDVNNALNPIMAAAYLLRHHAESPDVVRDYADRIRKAAETGAATASRVGRFIRQEPVHPGTDMEVDLSVLADEAVGRAEPVWLKRATDSGEVRVVRMFADGVVTRGLPEEIREAVLNLVQNAIDAMPKGGTLTVRTAVDGTEACIVVRDTGVGMSAEVRERAFEPFFTTKIANGAGLGLAEVYGIARRHRGRATIASTPALGTEVAIRLPLLRPSGTGNATDDAAPPVSRRILVVEDHDDGRELLQRILQRDGHEVTAVASCTAARAALADQGDTSFHLMLTDVGLPDGNGWELVKYAKGEYPHLRVGVITGWEPTGASEHTNGAEFVLRKPLRAAELKAHIAGRPSSVSPLG